ncbi:MAG: 30S ribosomal protein S2, partial [Thermodesulfovibrionales bacterium]
MKELIKEVATECDFPYVNERWLGGTFTNFRVIRKRVEYLFDLERKRDEGFFEKYTKRERAEIEKEIEKVKEELRNEIKDESLEKILDVFESYARIIFESSRKNYETEKISEEILKVINLIQKKQENEKLKDFIANEISELMEKISTERCYSFEELEIYVKKTFDELKGFRKNLAGFDEEIDKKIENKKDEVINIL